MSTFVGQQKYFPEGVVIPNYAANVSPVPELLLYFFSGWAVILGGAVFIASRLNRNLGACQLLSLSWFVLCGFIHLFFEGYYSYNVFTIAGNQDLFGQLWKEYAQADSRYLTPDAFMHSMETFTAFIWGPLCFFIAYAIVARNSLRHPIQLIVSSGQLYGTILYFATAEFDLKVYGKSFTRPEPYYVYFYYMTMNLLWVIVPATLVFSSVRACKAAFVAADLATVGKKKQ